MATFPTLRRELVAASAGWRPEAVTLESLELCNGRAPDLSSCASSVGCARSLETTMLHHQKESTLGSSAPTVRRSLALLPTLQFEIDTYLSYLILSIDR